VFAEVLEWLGLKPGPDTIRLHREDKKTTHACPGKLVTKDWFITKVKAAMGVTPDIGVGPVEVERPKAQLYDIKEIQTRLKAHGFDPGPLDGLMGKRTEAAIRAAQVALGLGPTGVVGPWLMSKLLEAAKAPVEPPKPATERKPIADMHMSDKGLDLLKHFEGLRLTPYMDNGELAIGYGHANHSKKPPKVVEGMRITEEEALKILATDLIDYENRVKQSITVPLKQGEFDALVSIAYNWGPGNLDRSELRNLVNAGKYAEAEAEIRTILPSTDKKFYAGIKRRRGKEADLFGG
jgi:lysozyme